jgi:hypothetical protein
MTKDEALDLALEALELHGKQYPHMVKGYCLDAITAIKQALAAQPAPVQPVASLKEVDVLIMAEAHGIDPSTKGLYGFYIDCISNQPAAQPAPVQEPFGYVYEAYCLPECACEMEWVESFDRYEPDAAENIRNVTPVYTTPPAGEKK